MAIAPDGSRLAAVGTGHTIYLYAASGDGSSPEALGSHRGDVTSLRFAPGGNRLVSTSSDRTARLFDLTGHGDPISLLGHSASIKASAFSADGRLLATAGDDQTMRLWDADSGQCLMVLRHESEVLSSVAFSSDGEYLAAGTGSGSPDVVLYRITNYRARQVLAGHHYFVSGLAFHPDGRTLFSTSGDTSAIKWNLLSGSIGNRWTPSEGKLVKTCTLSPDGSLLATADGAFSGQSAATYEVCLWDTATARKRKSFSLHKAQVSAASFDPAGKYLATGDDDGGCFVWDLNQESPVARPVTEHSQVMALGFIHGPSRLLTAYSNGQIEVSEARQPPGNDEAPSCRRPADYERRRIPRPEIFRCRHSRRTNPRHRNDRSDSTCPDRQRPRRRCIVAGIQFRWGMAGIGWPRWKGHRLGFFSPPQARRLSSPGHRDLRAGLRTPRDASGHGRQGNANYRMGSWHGTAEVGVRWPRLGGRPSAESRAVGSRPGKRLGSPVAATDHGSLASRRSADSRSDSSRRSRTGGPVPRCQRIRALENGTTSAASRAATFVLLADRETGLRKRTTISEHD